MILEQPIHEDSIEDMIVCVKNGDREMQHHLLVSYQPFIAKAVSEVCKRYIDPETDDEFSIGLYAFNEAIFKYSPDRGSSFLSFAKLVVKRKVIDYIRSMRKHPTTMSLNDVFGDGQMENPLEIATVHSLYKEKQDAARRKEEMRDLEMELAKCKLSLQELTEVSPKHKDARASAICNARILYEDETLSQFVRKKKKLPIKELSRRVDVSKKTLERNRKFILAIFLVLDGDYVFLQDYIREMDSE